MSGVTLPDVTIQSHVMDSDFTFKGDSVLQYSQMTSDPMMHLEMSFADLGQQRHAFGNSSTLDYSLIHGHAIPYGGFADSNFIHESTVFHRPNTSEALDDDSKKQSAGFNK